MPAEPGVKHVIAFVDGQNLFHAAKKAFGSRFPNYNPKVLAERICADHGWTLSQTFFYTGIPDRTDNAFWNHFWTAKLAVMGTRGIEPFPVLSATATRLCLFPGAGQQRFLWGRRKALMSVWRWMWCVWRGKTFTMWR